MINREKICIYKKYNGDSDAWARVGSLKEKTIMSDIDWYLIDGLLQNLKLFPKNTKQILIDCSEDEEIRVELMRLAELL